MVVFRQTAVRRKRTKQKFMLKNDKLIIQNMKRISFLIFILLISFTTKMTAQMDKTVMYVPKYEKYNGKIYYDRLELEQADTETFEIFDILYAKDKNRVYHNDRIIEKADVKTFEVLEYPYSKDKRYAYCHSEILKYADPKTFETLGKYGYAKDKKQVYHYGKILKGENPKKFVHPAILPIQY